MSSFDKEWSRVVQNIINNGYRQTPEQCRSRYIKDDEPAPTIYTIGETMKYDEFPVSFSKKVPLRLVWEEMKKIFIDKSIIISEYRDAGIKFWDKWEGPDGTMGRTYGYCIATQLSPFPLDCFDEKLADPKVDWDARKDHSKNTVMLDQVDLLIQTLNHPTMRYSRSNVINMFIPNDISKSMIKPCVYASEYHVVGDGILCPKINTRSNDMALGHYFNVPGYWLFASLLCHVTGLKMGEMTFSIGNAHLYDRHVEGATEIIKNLDHVKNERVDLAINIDLKSIYDAKFEDFSFIGFKEGEDIKFDLAYTE